MNNISLKVESDILGPNGAGKTILLIMLGGIMIPASGSVSIFGREFHDNPSRYKRLIGRILIREYQALRKNDT